MATDWLKLAKDSFEASTSFIDDNYRKNWNADLRAFRSEHPEGSKYLSDAFKNRSKGFNPKTRTFIRKNEAAAASALFSNFDVINIDPVDSDDLLSVANSKIGKELMQYRLTKTIPWFKLSMASFQEAMTLGVVASYQYWEFQGEQKEVEIPDAMDEEGNPAKQTITVPLVDKPCIELRPLENLRFSPSADWLDPLNTTPYFIDMIPMYVDQVRAMGKKIDDKTGEPKWKLLKEEEIRIGLCDGTDSTRIQRNESKTDRYDEPQPISEFDTVWVHRNFVKTEGKTYVYYTLSTHYMLSQPVPVEEVYPHLERGKLPYTFGICVIEAHQPAPGGLARLAAPQQQEANEIRNERRDNVKLVLNKRWKVARGKQVDLDALLRNVPGGVVMMNDTNLDVQEINWPDVTQSSYVEEDRINMALDDLVGNFSGSTRQANTAMNDTLGGAKMGQQSESLMQEYVLRTWIETWCEPTLQQLLALEQYYESDPVVLALAGKKAQLWRKFGINQVSDELLRKQLTLTINVGMGATSPDGRLRKFLAATEMAIKVTAESPPGFNAPEAVKEIYSLAGMRDGARFFGGGQHPQMAKAMQMIQQLQTELKTRSQETQVKAQLESAKIQSDQQVNAAKIQVDAQRIQGDLRIRELELTIEQQRLEIEKAKLGIEQQSGTVDVELKVAEMQQKLTEAQDKLAIEKEKMQLERERMALEMQKHQSELQSADLDRAQKGQEIEAKRVEIDNKSAEVQAKLAPVKQTQQKNDMLEKLIQQQVDSANAMIESNKKLLEMMAKPKVLSVSRGQTGELQGKVTIQ